MDNGNNKKAFQEAEKVLKKQPDFVCCKALKSLALIRLNREDEAVPILDSITNQGTTDEGALQAMNIAYRELQQSIYLFVDMYVVIIRINYRGTYFIFSSKNMHIVRKRNKIRS